MPNHVTTIIKSSNQDLVKSLKDFNQIIPMPKVFDEFGIGICIFFEIDNFIEFVKSQNLTNIDKDVLKKLATEFAPYNDVRDRDKDEFILQAHCYFETGYKDPIDWARANWDTKWNSYDYELTNNGCKFDTAWTHPFSVIQKLSEMYPDDEIEVKYADEDIGYNLGHYKIKNSHIEIIFDEDKQSMKDRKWFAYCVKGYQDNMYGLKKMMTIFILMIWRNKMSKNPSEVIKSMFKAGHNYVLCHVTKTVNGNIVHSKDIIHTWDAYSENVWYGCNGVWESAIPFDRKTGRTIVDFVNGKILLSNHDDD